MDMTRFFAYPTQEAASSSNNFVLLPGWSAREWDRLLTHTQTYRFHAGDVVIHEGDTERALYLVLSGRFEVFVPHKQYVRLVAIIDPGAVIGEQAFFDTRPRSATINAISSGEVARLSFDAFEIFAAREPKLAYEVLLDLGRIMSIRLRQHMTIVTTSSEVTA